MSDCLFIHLHDPHLIFHNSTSSWDRKLVHVSNNFAILNVKLVSNSTFFIIAHNWWKSGNNLVILQRMTRSGQISSSTSPLNMNFVFQNMNMSPDIPLSLSLSCLSQHYFFLVKIKWFIFSSLILSISDTDLVKWKIVSQKDGINFDWFLV